MTDAPPTTTPLHLSGPQWLPRHLGPRPLIHSPTRRIGTSDCKFEPSTATFAKTQKFR